MGNRKLRGYVLPTIYVFTITALFVSAILIGKTLKTFSDGTEYNYVTSAIINDVKPVVQATNEKIIKPFNVETIEISKYFYNKDDSVERQQKSLIFYENTYMQNSGVLYGSDESFEVVVVMDGTVKNIKEDNILGTVIEIEHNNKLTTIYQSLGKTNVKIGDVVKQGTVIGVSGPNSLENEKPHNLLFEVYHNGSLINPEEFYNLKVENLLD